MTRLQRLIATAVVDHARVRAVVDEDTLVLGGIAVATLLALLLR